MRVNKKAVTLPEFLQSLNYISVQMSKTSIGHFEVEALINGQTARLLIDTGASRSVVAHDRVTHYGLETIDSEIKAGGIGTTNHTVKFGDVKTLSIQSFHINSWSVAVMDLSHVNQGMEAHGIKRFDGIIGSDLMRDNWAIIDYGQEVIYLREDCSRL